MKKSTLEVRGLRTNIQEWGDPSNQTIILLHGWMDCGASYKFIAEHLANDYHLVAPDLRGFGETEHADSYWFPDYFADLDVVIDKFSYGRPARLVGHSMGGNIVAMYAGIQPHKVSDVLVLEALGLPQTQPSEAPEKYRRWMRESLSDEPTRIYPNKDALMRSITKGNPSLSFEMISELAELWGKTLDDGIAMSLKHDHKHRFANPVRYNFDDVLEIWKEVTARVGLVMARNSWMFQQFSQSDRIDVAKSALRVTEPDYYIVDDSAHMLHLEQPEATANCIRQFFS